MIKTLYVNAKLTRLMTRNENEEVFMLPCFCWVFSNVFFIDFLRDENGFCYSIKNNISSKKCLLYTLCLGNVSKNLWKIT